MKRYNNNIQTVLEHIKKLLPNLTLSGQWSVDIMQNGDDFWIIDMATAETSAFYDKVAMKQVTEALGHSRIDVIADHYLHI